MGASFRQVMVCLMLAGLTALAACSGKREADARPSGVAMKERMLPGASAPRRPTLAYAHEIQINTPEDRIAAVHQAALASCRDLSAELCEMLESRIGTGRHPFASAKFRAKPEGIRKLMAALSQQGEVASQSTTAEDLAGPIQDGEKQLAMLTAYRAELESLRKRPGNDVDALIKVTRELSQVQSELESATGKQAALLKRVETETLEVSINAQSEQSFWKPITLALSEFGNNLANGISSAITGVAYVLPWSLVLGVVFWVLRRLWRKRRVQ